MKTTSKILRRVLLLGLAALGWPAMMTAQQAKPAMASPPAAAQPAPAAASDPAAAYYHYMLGRWYEDRAGMLGGPENVRMAIEQFREAMHADPGSAYLPAQMASLLFRAGRTGDAIRLARSVVRSHPKNLEAHELLGWLYTRLLGNEHDRSTHALLDLAIEQYQIMVRLRPGDVKNHYRLSELYLANHQLPQAAAELHATLRLRPGYSKAVTRLIELYGQEDQLDTARAVLQKVPAGARTAPMLAAIARAEGDHQHPHAAMRDWRAALQLDDSNREYHSALAGLLAHFGSAREAIGQYRWLARNNPQDARAWLQLTALYEKEGEFPRADAALRQAAQLLPDSPAEIGYYQAILNEAEGKFAQAIAVLQHWLHQTAQPNGYSGEAAFDRSAFLQELGRLERSQGNLPAALDAFHQMQALGPNADRHAWMELAETYRRQHQYAQALNAARQGLAHYPNSQALRISASLLQAETGAVETGLATLQPLLTLNPNDPEILLVSAQINQAGKRWPAAIGDARRAARLATSNQTRSEAALVLADICNQRRQFKRADGYYRRALALSPRSPMVLNDYGYMLADRGVDLRRALAYIQQAVHLSAHNGAYLDSLGWVQFKLHLWPEAAANLRQANQLQYQDPTVLGHLGFFYLSTGHARLAVEYLSQAVEAWRTAAPGDFDSRQAARTRQWLRRARKELSRRLKAGPTPPSHTLPKT